MRVVSTDGSGYVLAFREIDQTQVAVVGGKGANLGELSKIDGIRVPPGFCITTDAFRRIMVEAPSIDHLLEQLSGLEPDDHDAIRALSAEVRRVVEDIAIPDDLATAITHALAQCGEQVAYAVRSSATAEDLPTASFAGQQDTYLNISGPAAILTHVRRCWASLFTERAVTYRLHNSVDHRKVHMAVVIQQMVFPHASGILFTADPVTGNRKVVSVDASLQPSAWGSDVSLHVEGFRPGTLCTVWLRRSDGAKVPAGSFRYVWGGESDEAQLSSGLDPPDVKAIGLKAGSRTFTAPVNSSAQGSGPTAS